MRPALFANLFGVLALFQSGRLVKVRAFGKRDMWTGLGGVGDSGMSCSYPLILCGHQDSEALMKSVKLLQVLAQHHNHLQEQPQKALVDILSEVQAFRLCATRRNMEKT